MRRGCGRRNEMSLRANMRNSSEADRVLSLAPRFSGVSHWVNENNLVSGKFAWGRGYGAFSVSESNVDEVAKYIASQEEHHRKKSFAEELRLFVKRYGLKWHDE